MLNLEAPEKVEVNAVEMRLLPEKVQRQKMIFTSRMQHSLKILQMPLFELQQNIAKELEENAALEVEPEEPDSIDGEQDKAILQWIQLMGRTGLVEPGYYREENDCDAPWNWIGAKQTLKDYLMEQIYDLDIDEQQRAICVYLVENIDERGYLGCSVEEIAAVLKVSTVRVVEALTSVQNFQPCGIAARDLKECLRIQLHKKQVRDKKVYTLVDECLDLLAARKIKAIARRLNVGPAKIQGYCRIIQTLEPKPARGFYTGSPENYSIPEAYIRKIGTDLYVLMNEKALPRLTVNPLYAEILTRPGETSKTLEFVKEKLNCATVLIREIEQRTRTLTRIIEKIVELQKDYFSGGIASLKPMTIKEVADSLQIHESTVSRAIRDKYISTPSHTVLIKEFFSAGIASDLPDGTVSAKWVKNAICNFILDEDKAHPLSDQELCIKLQSCSIKVSRRTVAKYRETLGIASLDKRRAY